MRRRKVLPGNCGKGPPGEPRVPPHRVWEGRGGRAGELQSRPPPAYRGPVRPDLPLAADLELAGAGGVGLLQVLAAVGLHRQAAVGVHLAAEDLPVLHAQAAGFAALGPLPDVPAVREETARRTVTSVNRKRASHSEAGRANGHRSIRLLGYGRPPAEGSAWQPASAHRTP